jgi:hypothetical protein
VRLHLIFIFADIYVGIASLYKTSFQRKTQMKDTLYILFNPNMCRDSVKPDIIGRKQVHSWLASELLHWQLHGAQR